MQNHSQRMRRLLASGLLPKRAGQPVKALVHISFAELADRDAGSALQDTWIGEYRARWAAHRAAASVATGDGGAWLEGDAARAIACDAMIVPVVTGDIDPAALEDLILLCARYHRLRAGITDPADLPGHDIPGHDLRGHDLPGHDLPGNDIPGHDLPGHDLPGHDLPGNDLPGNDIPGPSGPAGAQGGAPVPAGLAGRAARQAQQAAMVAEALADLEHQILAKVLQVLSGPGGAASFLRRNLLGQGLNGPSLPLDVGQTDDIPVHLRRLVALRDQTCQYPGGCDQPASGCEPHHVVHRADGGRTSLTNLKDYCWWHHHVVLHQLGWTLTAHPDGTSQVTSPAGKTIRSHSPPPRPG